MKMELSCWISLPVKDRGVKKIRHSRIAGHFTLILHQKNPACPHQWRLFFMNAMQLVVPVQPVKKRCQSCSTKYGK